MLSSLRFALTLLVCALPAIAQPSPKDINPAAKSIAMAAALPGYDVVSVRQNKSDSGDSILHTTGDGILIENATFPEILEFAYNIASFDQISSTPGAVGSAHFDIKAKITARDDSKSAQFTDEQLQAMVIPLLAERFHLQVRVVPKKMMVYELVVGKDGPKFKLDQTEHEKLTADWGKENTLIFKQSSMATLAGVLSDSGMHRLVVDRTGLKGAGDFSLKWSSEAAEEQGGSNVVSIFTAIEDQLGLKLMSAKLPIDTVVIDHVEMPSDN